MKKLIVLSIILSVYLSMFALIHTETFQKDGVNLAMPPLSYGGNQVVETSQYGLVLEWSVNEMNITERTPLTTESQWSGQTFTNL